MAVKFLDRFDIQAPAFDFIKTRTVGRTRNLRAVYTVEAGKLFTVSFALATDSFGDSRLGAFMDVHMQEHFDGSPFETRWPQHLGTDVGSNAEPVVRTNTLAGATVVPVAVPASQAPMAGRYMRLSGHEKLYLITAVKTSPANAKTITVTPPLYHAAAQGEMVMVSPYVNVRYSPEMVTAQTYRDGVMADRTVRLEEAWPDTA